MGQLHRKERLQEHACPCRKRAEGPPVPRTHFKAFTGVFINKRSTPCGHERVTIGRVQGPG